MDQPNITPPTSYSMKDHWGSEDALLNLSGMEEEEFVRIEKPDWGYVRTLPKHIQQAIRTAWLDTNPHKEGDENPLRYAAGIKYKAKKYIENNCKRCLPTSKGLLIKWKPENVFKCKDINGMYDVELVEEPNLELIFKEGQEVENVNIMDYDQELVKYSPKRNSKTKEEQIDYLVKEMNLSPQQAKHVIMLRNFEPTVKANGEPVSELEEQPTIRREDESV